MVTLRRARKAIKSVDSSQLARMAKSRDSYVRCMVAENQNADSAVLAVLARDEASTVRSAVAKNPATPMEILRQMITNPPENGHYWGWEEIAKRDDLSAEVVEAFSRLEHQDAVRLLERITDGHRFGHSWSVRMNPRVLERLVGIPQPSRGGTRSPSPSILRHAVEIRDCWTLETMLIVANSGDTPSMRRLALQTGLLMPREVAVALAQSDDWQVLDRTVLCKELTEGEKEAILKRLEASPEWCAKRDEHLAIIERSRVVDGQGRVLQEAALPSGTADSKVEEVFWDAYRMMLPSALDGLEAQHRVGKFRLDFAIPQAKIGIELDGFRYHSSQEAIINDRQRQRALELQGWRLIRFAAQEVLSDPQSCVRQAATWVDTQGSSRP